MTRWLPAALLLLAACGGEPTDPPVAGDRPSAPAVPSTPVPSTPRTPPEATAPWLATLLAQDLRSLPTDERTMALGERLGATVACPRPGTGCFVELPLGGQVTQVHLADDQAIQIWGPTEPMEMPGWVEAVEAEIDRSPLRALNPPGTRPDRLWRSADRVVLLHDHTGQPCGGFCPSMIWISVPDHPAAAGYGFRDD